MEKRVFLIVLDSFGIGAEPDAAAFGDEGTNTLGAIAGHPNFRGDNLARLGMFNLDGVTCGTPAAAPIGTVCQTQHGPVQGIRGAFWALGALTLPVCLAGSAVLSDPPQKKQQPSGKNTLDLSPGQMLRTKQYWLCAGAVCFSTPAVLLFSPIILKLGMERGLDETAALWSIVLGSVGSAAGRMLMPMLSDHIGRRATDLGLFAASLGLSAAFWAAQGWWVVVCYAGLTFCYSALAAVLPALSTDLFGLPHAGVNYGFLALGQSVGSLTFPFAANLLALENGRHLLAMAGAAAGFAAIWALHPVQKDPR